MIPAPSSFQLHVPSNFRDGALMINSGSVNAILRILFSHDDHDLLKLGANCLSFMSAFNDRYLSYLSWLEISILIKEYQFLNKNCILQIICKCLLPHKKDTLFCRVPDYLRRNGNLRQICDQFCSTMSTEVNTLKFLNLGQYFRVCYCCYYLHYCLYSDLFVTL